MSKMSECGLTEFDDPRIVSLVKYARVLAMIVNYVCRDRVEGTQYTVVLFQCRDYQLCGPCQEPATACCPTTIQERGNDF